LDKGIVSAGRHFRKHCARLQHVFEGTKGIHVMTNVSLCLQRPEQAGEVEVALTRVQMFLVAVAKTVGEADFADAGQRHGVDEALDPLRNQMGVIGGERQAQRRESSFS